jgi:hypothetical protein
VWQFLSSQAITQPLRLLAVMKIIGLLMGDDVWGRLFRKTALLKGGTLDK